MCIISKLQFHQSSNDDAKQEEKIKKEGQTLSKNLWYIFLPLLLHHKYSRFMKQTVGNACGTIGVVHSVANNLDSLNITPGSHFAKFFELTHDKNSEERAKVLETYQPFAVVHQDSAREGQTQAVDEDVNLHFIALVHKDGHLYELYQTTTSAIVF